MKAHYTVTSTLCVLIFDALALTAAVLPQSASAQNQIDDPTFFVVQHYFDFLNRDPDQAGLNSKVNQITSCNGNLPCIDLARQNVSASFFLSREFQETGFYVIKLQRAAFGKISSDATKRMSLSQFLTDARAVGAGFIDGQAGAEAVLDQNQTAYAQAVAGSFAFIARYPTMLSASAYVDALFTTAGVTPTSAERQAAINAFGAGDTPGRAAALRVVARTDTIKNAEFNSAFVLMQYFGYLRRNPTDPPDVDDSGYQFWLGKLNAFNGDPIGSEMVRSFILSTEYRARFDPNTRPGSNVVVRANNNDATVTFATVSQAGITTFTPIVPASAGAPPSGYTIVTNGPAYDITTTATFTPPIDVCFTVTSTNDATAFSKLWILHRENGVLVDRTFRQVFDARQICARVSSLSPFVLAMNDTSIPLKILSITRPASNTIHLQCLGVPNAANRIEYSLNLSSGSFSLLATPTADATGAFQYDDTNAGAGKFYRLAPP